jgi:murein DD-endopeptidase MepM/ murein hydrolase activator NlpD
VRSGRVRRAGRDPVLYGNYLLLHGQGERRSYFYSHLRRQAAVGPGDRVYAGQRIGAVGATGNARTVGCHLHFEIWVNGDPIDPEPALRRWDRRHQALRSLFVGSWPTSDDPSEVSGGRGG